MELDMLPTYVCVCVSGMYTHVLRTHPYGRIQIASMRWPNPQNAPLPKGSRHVRMRAGSPTTGGEDAAGAKQGAAGGSQMDEMRALLQVC